MTKYPVVLPNYLVHRKFEKEKEKNLTPNLLEVNSPKKFARSLLFLEVNSPKKIARSLLFLRRIR